MRQIALILLAALMISPALGQERKDLSLSLAGGKMASPYYQNNKSGRFFSLDFDYSLAKRHTLSVNYTGGEHFYYDNVHTSGLGTLIRSNGTNAEATYNTFSVLYKYSFLSGTRISGSAGTGLGLMTHSRIYPFSTANSSFDQQSAWTDLVFPVRLEVDYPLSNNIKAGVIGGFFVQPDFPVLAYHVGPRLSFTIR